MIKPSKPLSTAFSRSASVPVHPDHQPGRLLVQRVEAGDRVVGLLAEVVRGAAGRRRAAAAAWLSLKIGC
jgi:hypothetical protein